MPEGQKSDEQQRKNLKGYRTGPKLRWLGRNKTLVVPAGSGPLQSLHQLSPGALAVTTGTSRQRLGLQAQPPLPLRAVQVGWQDGRLLVNVRRAQLVGRLECKADEVEVCGGKDGADRWWGGISWGWKGRPSCTVQARGGCT